MSTIVSTYTFTVVECCNCGVPFALTNEMCARRRSDGDWFYCPNGHTQHYSDGDAKKLARARSDLDMARARERAVRDQLEAAERSRAAFKGQVTKIRRRVGNGVCPCCSRSFVDLTRHMHTQHPGFAHPDSDAAAS